MDEIFAQQYQKALRELDPDAAATYQKTANLEPVFCVIDSAYLILLPRNRVQQRLLSQYVGQLNTLVILRPRLLCNLAGVLSAFAESTAPFGKELRTKLVQFLPPQIKGHKSDAFKAHLAQNDFVLFSKDQEPSIEGLMRIWQFYGPRGQFSVPFAEFEDFV